MTYERSVQANIPNAARNRKWLATALLEAPDADGQPGEWKPIEAVPGESELVRMEVRPGVFQQVAVPTGVVADTVSTRHAEHDPGWYRLQWYDDGQNSKFSTPVKIGSADTASSGRWN